MKPRRILILEQDAIFRKALAEALEARGMQVLRSDIFGAPDVVVMEMRLLEHEAPSWPPGPAIKVLMAGIRPSKKQLNGADTFILKPFDADDLLDVIEQVERTPPSS